MSRLDETITVTQHQYYAYDPNNYVVETMLEEIAISLAVIADKLTEQHESEVTE